MGRSIIVEDDQLGGPVGIDHDLMYSDEDLDNCVPARAWLSDIPNPFAFIEISHSYWRGITWPGCAVESNATLQRVGETIAHEWGHHQFELYDERIVGSANQHKCRHSLMAGSRPASYITATGWRYFEFCTWKDHGINPTEGVAAATGDSNWTDFTQEYLEMTTPMWNSNPISSDFSQLAPLFSTVPPLMQSMTATQGPW
jgi:hypothetical protein